MIEAVKAMRDLNVFMSFVVVAPSFPVAAFLLKEDAEKFVSLFPHMGYEIVQLARV